MAPIEQLGPWHGTAIGILLALTTLGARCLAQDDVTGAEDRPRSFETSAEAAKRVEIDSLIEAAEEHFREGRMSDVLTAYQRAEGLAREIQDRDLLADRLNDLGLVYRQLADYHQAVSLYSQALDICTELGDVPCQAEALHNIGVTYTYLGELEAAEDRLNDARDLWPTEYEKSATLTALGTVHDLRKDSDQAIKLFREALVLRYSARGVDDTVRKRGKAVTLSRLATAFKNAGKMNQAQTTYQTVLSLLQEIDDRRRIGLALDNLGWTYVEWRRPDAALTHFRQALLILEAGQLLQPLAHTLLGMGQAYRQKKDLRAATGVLERALDITATLYAKPQGPRLKASFLAHRQPYYELYIDVMMQRYKLEKDPRHSARALEAAERFRARSLLELLNEERAALRRVADPAALDLEERLLREINARNRQRLDMLYRKASVDEIARVENELRFLNLRYEHLKAQLRLRLADPAPQPLSVREIQELLDDDTLLLFYALGEERSYLWLVSRKRIRSHELPGREEIETAAEEVYNWLKDSDQRGGEAAGREAVARLSKTLLAPVARELKDRRLAVVADGKLHYVPFAALSLPSGDSLIADREIVSIPSASVMATLRRRAEGRPPAHKHLAVVADPVFAPSDSRVAASGRRTSQASSSAGPPPPERLIYSAQESRAILELVSPQHRYAALGFDANHEMVLSGDLDGHRFVHFAVHGEFHEQQPEYTHLVLSLLDRQGRPRNGRLYMHEIDDLRLPAELVVLSACNTALGELVRGEGLMGMTRSFMDAGASRVLVSLWFVNDEATARLIQRFYREMFGEGKTAAAALRVAQLSLRDDPRWQAPYYWAGFVLEGDWQ